MCVSCDVLLILNQSSFASSFHGQKLNYNLILSLFIPKKNDTKKNSKNYQTNSTHKIRPAALTKHPNRHSRASASPAQTIEGPRCSSRNPPRSQLASITRKRARIYNLADKAASRRDPIVYRGSCIDLYSRDALGSRRVTAERIFFSSVYGDSR